MADLSIQALLAPVSAEAPSGPDLTYDADFLALEQAALGKAEQQLGDNVIPAEEPDWRDVYERAEALLGRSKDLRVAVLLARALTRMHQVEGLAAGLKLIREMLAQFWESVHPELDREDNDDPTMRLNALAPLSDSGTFLRDIRHAFLVSSTQHGRVSIRDVLVALGKWPASGENQLSEGQISATLRAAGAENPAPLQAALAAADELAAIESLLSEKELLTQAPDLKPITDILRVVTPLCRAALGSGGTAAGDESQPVAAALQQESRGAPGEILSRDDAVQALENVCRFIERSEPSNPAPLLIRRAQRLMSRTFVEIIQDLAPESLEQIQKLAGLQDSSSEA